MNKEYTYIDGKVIISDEFNNKRVSEYYNNLDKVLIEENLIEYMEGKIQELEEESKKYKKYNSKRYIPVILPMVTLISTVGAPLMLSLLTGTNSFVIPVDTIFGTMSEALEFSIATSIWAIPLGATLEFGMYKDHKNSIKTEKGINSELDFLKIKIEKEREILKSLKQEKSKNNENTEFRTVIIDDLQKLKALKILLDFYFDLGYNGAKYYEYYQKGELERKLQKYYNSTGLQLAKEYFEEKGPSLSLRKSK